MRERDSVAERQRISIVSGTRPEIVKLAPVYAALRARPEIFEPTWIATGQHASLADRAFADFHITPDMSVDLAVLPADISQRVGATVAALGPALLKADPHLVVVQGDTASALAGALAAAARGVPVAHVEAGLRSFDFYHPYPEESIRHLIAKLAYVHFAPTQRAAKNLLDEGHLPSRVHVTGNTVVDALMSVLPNVPTWPRDVPAVSGISRVALVTTHRRESWGAQIDGIAQAVLSVVNQVTDIEVVLPFHPNPVVRQPLEAALGQHPRVHLTNPLGYMDFVSVLRRATLVLTDSGGVQEEAATLGIPTLVMRKVTERMEAVEAGVARLVGTERAAIEREALRLLTNEAARQEMKRAGNPFGDGRAGENIAALLARDLLKGRAGHQQGKPGVTDRLTAS